MKMNKYEVVDMTTGELIEIETKIDISLLEEYNQWVVDNKLNPPTYSPKEYAMYLESEIAKRQLAKAIEVAEFYNKGTVWDQEIVEGLLRIMRNEE
jgi:hypothetical protein